MPWYTLPVDCRVGGVFAERSARSLRRISRQQIGRIAQKQAQCRVAGIGFLQHQKSMRLSANVIHTKHVIRSKPALKREHVFLGVGNAIAWWDSLEAQ